MKSPTEVLSTVTRWSNSHVLAADALFAALVGGLSLIGYVTAEATASQRPQDALGVVLIVAQTLAFTTRRTAPLRSLIGVLLLTIAFWIADYPTNVDIFSLLAVYAATAHGSSDRRLVWRTVGAAVGLLTTIAILGVIVPSEDLPAAAVVGIAAIHVTSAIVGQFVYDRRHRLAGLERRAIRAEAEREMLARQAVLDERTRIARDLHDVVAHGMTVMVVQAGAAERLIDRQPERAARALQQIQATGREALTEMRRMLGVLRDQDHEPDFSPQPTIDDVEQLIRHCVDSGVPAELIVDGPRPAQATATDLTTYRVVQEALTNVIKHAGRPAQAVVKLTYSPAQIRVEINDNGRGITVDALRSTVAHGLIGMRERVELFGGHFHAGPRPGGGFRVAATIPLDHVSEAV
jgi:signal transduction histidine kinase